MTSSGRPRPLGESAAWGLLRALAARAAQGVPLCETAGFRFRDNAWVSAEVEAAHVLAAPGTEHGFRALSALTPEAEQLLAIFMPLCVGTRSARLVIGHLGQSLDGRVATVTGASQFITGAEDLRHTHRLRALCDAVLVGARTVAADNPRLTTRLVEGPTPVRVVLDPSARLPPAHRIFRDDKAPTLVVVGEGREVARRAAHTRVLHARVDATGFDVHELLEQLRRQGLQRIFVEGGGVTISRFVSARALDRLHLTVAPKILGSGAPALSLPPVEQLSDATPLSCRHFALGQDVLFDCDLRPT